jgi:hypothetical protein
VNAFLKLKAESSGWPEECRTPEQRLEFLREFAEHEGIELDPAQMEEPNAGMRYIAVSVVHKHLFMFSLPLKKIMLNSLYGKMGQRPEHTSTHYTTSAREFHQMLEDPTQEVLDFEHLNERMDRVVVRKRGPFVKAPATNSLAVACFVTSLARLRLYKFMEEAVLAGHHLLYCDTDSLLYVLRRLLGLGGGGLPVLEGEWMGDMKRELPGRRLVEFIAAGPKNYAYVHVARDVAAWQWRQWLEAPAEAADRMAAVLRIRGIQLTYTAQQLLNYTSMRRLVHDHFDVFGHRAAAAAAGLVAGGHYLCVCLRFYGEITDVKRRSVGVPHRPSMCPRSSLCAPSGRMCSPDRATSATCQCTARVWYAPGDVHDHSDGSHSTPLPPMMPPPI